MSMRIMVPCETLALVATVGLARVAQMPRMLIASASIAQVSTP